MKRNLLRALGIALASAPVLYFLIAAYQNRHMLIETPEVLQIWVAYLIFFGGPVLLAGTFVVKYSGRE